MKYTSKEQIIGLHFKFYTDPITEYMIDYDSKKERIIVNWEEPQPNSTTYSIENALQNLNERRWIPINNEPNYEIY